MTDRRNLTHIIGDMPLDRPMIEQLSGFIDRAGVEVTQPARPHVAGWVWSGRVADLAVTPEHEPINVLTVRSPTPLVIVRHVVCLTIRGVIDHVMQVGPHSAAIWPTSAPEAMRQAMRSENCAWWACPFRETMRCTCLHPEAGESR